MKKSRLLILTILSSAVLLSGCGSKAADEDPAAVTAEVESLDKSTEADTTEAEITEAETADPTPPEGNIVDGALASQENPVPLGTWASITVSDGGYPKNAYARMLKVITDPAQTQALIDAYDAKNPDDPMLTLEEHAEFLEYVIVEYEVYFPGNFTDSEHINFGGIILRRENNQEDWIASDGSDYYWLGTETRMDVPSRESGYPKNGDTVQCKVAFPMIKGYTDYTLLYSERNEELTETINTYFSLE